MAGYQWASGYSGVTFQRVAVLIWCKERKKETHARLKRTDRLFCAIRCSLPLLSTLIRPAFTTSFPLFRPSPGKVLQ